MLQQLSVNPCIRQVCHLCLTQLVMSTSMLGGSTGVKKIKESGWQQQFLKAELYEMSREKLPEIGGFPESRACQRGFTGSEATREHS